MNERELKIVSLTGALLSLLAIYLFSLYAPANEVSVCNLDSAMKGDVVKLSGEAMNVRTSEGNIFFTLSEDGCEIKTIVWKSTAESMVHPIEEGDNISLEGFVDSYRGELEIITKKLS